MKQLLLLALALVLTQGAFAQKINTKASKIEFEVMNRGQMVGGTMLNMKGVVNFDAANLAESSFKATVDPSTVDTKSGGRDKHLQKDDFFGTSTFADITMESKSIAKTDAGFEAVATLTIRDVSMEVKIPFTVETTDNKQTLSGTLSVQRKEYKLGEKMDEGSIGFDVAVKIHCVVDL